MRLYLSLARPSRKPVDVDPPSRAHSRRCGDQPRPLGGGRCGGAAALPRHDGNDPRHRARRPRRGDRDRRRDLRGEHPPQPNLLAVRRGADHRGAVRLGRGARGAVPELPDRGAGRAGARRDRVGDVDAHFLRRVRLHDHRRHRAHDGTRQGARPAAPGGVLLRELRVGLWRQGRDLRARDDGAARVAAPHRRALPLGAPRHRRGVMGGRLHPFTLLAIAGALPALAWILPAPAGGAWTLVVALALTLTPGASPGVTHIGSSPGWRPRVSRVAYGAPDRRALLAVSPSAPRCAHDHRDRPPDHHDGRELRMAGGDARARATGGSDGRGRLERQRRVSPRGHDLRRTGAEGARPADRRSATLPGALAAGWDRGPAARAPRPRSTARPVGPARGGRASACARDPRARSRDPPPAARAAARPRGGAGRPLGPSPGLSRRAGATVHSPAVHMRSLTLDHASFWYPATASPALRDVSLEVVQGEVVALVGALGAGASTLLLVAADLAPRVPGGRLAGAVARRDRSGIVLPTPWTQASGMAFTVWDEVAFGPANLGWPTHEIARQVDRALEQLELVPLALRDPASLSGGELQRVIIASILAMDPGLVLFDEPAAELDAEAARALWRLIRLQAKGGKAGLLATGALDG